MLHCKTGPEGCAKLKENLGRHMTLMNKKKIFEEFAQYVTPERLQKIERFARERTRYITVVLEDIYQGHNMSAVLRSADCFGVQDVHIIAERNAYAVREEIAKGASQWLSLHHYNQKQVNNTEVCFDRLREQGYAIVATTPHEKDMLIEALPLDKKVALVFGTEQQGLSNYAMTHADAFVKIPMYGFTESFNISVCAGIALYEVNRRLRASSLPWRLTEDEILDLELEWLGITTSRGSQISERLASLK